MALGGFQMARGQARNDACHLTGKINDVKEKIRKAGLLHPTEALKRRFKEKCYHLLRAGENSKGDARCEHTPNFVARLFQNIFCLFFSATS